MRKLNGSVRKPRSLRDEKSPAADSMFRTSMAMGISTAMLMPLAAMGQASQAPAASTLPAVTVQDTALDPNPNAEVGAPYKAKTSGDSRHTRPLAETPQTISVITKSAIDDSGLTDLKQILGAQPGITLGTGENGNAFGDRYIIRGQEARSDVFVDGLRDPGMTTRESFAIEQLEISKGPNSSFAGRGTAGGAINAITKQATLDYDFTRASAAFGTDSHTRYTADVNHIFTDQFAIRMNALYGKEDVPGRSPSSRGRNGLALSGLYEFNQDLSVTLDYYGLRAKDKRPDLGGYLVGTTPNRVPATNYPVYAQAADFLSSDVDTLTARVKYRIDSERSISSLTRYGTSSNAYVTTGASSGTRYNFATGGTYTAAALDGGHTGWQEVDYFAHQTNFRWDTKIGEKKNEFIFGIEYTDHKVTSGNYLLTTTGANNCRTGTTAGALNAFCVTDPSGNVIANLSDLTGRTATRRPKSQDWHVKTAALSVMDTVDLTDRVTVFGGLRADHFNLTLQRFDQTTGAIAVSSGVVQNFAYSDTLFNGHLGLSYKLTQEGILYGSFASAQDINGGEPDSGTSAGYGGLVQSAGNVSSRPESSKNWELGTKWNLLDNKLLATAALFQTTKSDVMEGLNAADYTSAGTFNTGKNRVKGIEFGLSGNITPALSAQAGMAIMRSQVLGSYTPANVGAKLANFAGRSSGVQLKYQLTPAFSFGGAMRHESQRCGGQPDTGVPVCSQPVPSYTVYDLFAAYRFNKHLDMRVNVLNVDDKDYYTAVYRSGAFLYKGDARAVRVTFNYDL